MKFTAPVEAGQVFIFARSVGDGDPRYESQLTANAGDTLVVPLTFVRALDHFDPASTTRPTLPRQLPGRGGSGETLHAEQHFEYLAPFRAGDRVVAARSEGRTWTKQGRSGQLTFRETVTEYRNQDGTLLVRARKISVTTAVNPGA